MSYIIKAKPLNTEQATGKSKHKHPAHIKSNPVRNSQCPVEEKNEFESSEQTTCPHGEKCGVKLDIGLVGGVKKSLILKHYWCSGH